MPQAASLLHHLELQASADELITERDAFDEL